MLEMVLLGSVVLEGMLLEGMLLGSVVLEGILVMLENKSDNW